jgi:hypothetical protein
LFTFGNQEVGDLSPKGRLLPPLELFNINHYNIKIINAKSIVTINKHITMKNLSKLLVIFLLFRVTLCFAQETMSEENSLLVHSKINYTMVLNSQNGNLSLSIENHSTKFLQLDLETFFANRKPNKSYLQYFWAVPKIPNRLWTGMEDSVIRVPHSGRISTVEVYPPVPKYKTIILKKGEMFNKTIKVWDIGIWNQLKSTIEKDKKSVFEIHYVYTSLLPKTIDNKVPDLRTDIDYQQLLQIQKFKASWEMGVKNIDTSLLQSKLTLNDKTGDLTIYLENPIDVVVTLDLEQSFVKNFKIVESQKNEEVIPVLMKQKNEQSTFQRYRAIDLEEGEGFSKTIKIWELDIWSDIQNFFENDRTKSCTILGEISCWIDGKEYLYTGKYNLNYITFQKLQEKIKREKENEIKNNCNRSRFFKFGMYFWCNSSYINFYIGHCAQITFLISA